MRVQIPTYTDRWMMGDRYGEVVKVRRIKSRSPSIHGKEVAHVLLDKSGVTIPVWLEECTPV